MIRRSLDELAGWYRGRERASDYEAFRLRAFEGRSSREIAEATGIPAERVDNTCDRAQRRFGELVRREVAQTVEPGEVDQEIDYLMSLFRA